MLGAMVDRVEREEAANACGIPQRFGFVDAGGAIFGAYFVADGLARVRRGETPGYGQVEAILGAIMAVLHTRRFFAPARTRQLCGVLMCGEGR